MPAPTLVKSILDQSAALLNDQALTIFTYAFQLPHFRVAYAELEELLQQNNISISNETQAGFVINIGVVDIGGTTGPALPLDLIEIQELFEKTNGTSENFSRMVRCEFLPNLNVAAQSLIYYQFNDQFIKFLSVGATSVREIKINYVAANLPSIIDENTNVPVFNAKTFLAYRTAALCANYIGENETRATYLNGEAQLAIDRFLSINIKAYQSQPARRRPFRAAYKTRGWW